MDRTWYVGEMVECALFINCVASLDLTEGQGNNKDHREC